jgi:hypothetical protein
MSVVYIQLPNLLHSLLSFLSTNYSQPYVLLKLVIRAYGTK